MKKYLIVLLFFVFLFSQSFSTNCISTLTSSLPLLSPIRQSIIENKSITVGMGESYDFKSKSSIPYTIYIPGKTILIDSTVYPDYCFLKTSMYSYNSYTHITSKYPVYYHIDTVWIYDSTKYLIQEQIKKASWLGTPAEYVTRIQPIIMPDNSYLCPICHKKLIVFFIGERDIFCLFSAENYPMSLYNNGYENGIVYKNRPRRYWCGHCNLFTKEYMIKLETVSYYQYNLNRWKDINP